MTLNEYQQQAMTTCTPSSENFSYMMLNLVGEVGEFASKVAKLIRKGEACIGGADFYSDLRIYPENSEDVVTALRKEAGDILWQLSSLCKVMGWTLEEVAEENLAKLADRKKRDTIVGEGDER